METSKGYSGDTNKSYNELYKEYRNKFWKKHHQYKELESKYAKKINMRFLQKK